MAMLVKSGAECKSGDVPPGSFDSVKAPRPSVRTSSPTPRRGYDGRARARGCQL